MAGSSIADDYQGIYNALKVGVADTKTQDIYVFAAADGRTNDVGLLASLAGVGEDTDSDSNTPDVRLFADYSIVAVAAGSGSRTPCGSMVVKAFLYRRPWGV